jgi:hypothetical protein
MEEKMKRAFFVVMAISVIVLLAISCGGEKKATNTKTLSQRVESGVGEPSEATENSAKHSEFDRETLAATLNLMGYGSLRPQILGEVKPQIVKSQYPLQRTSMAYGLFGIKVLALKVGESLKASFNYTIINVEPDQFTIAVEHSDFTSDSESGPLSVYYFGDLSEFGPNGPVPGQQFLAYVSYHASAIKLGIALPIIVIDGIELK